MKKHFHRGIARCRSCCALGLLPLEPRQLLSIFYVDANAPGPTHDGLSWETAYTDLQQILPKAPAGSRILVADGTYKPTQDTDRTKSFVLRNGITLEGGYAGASDPSADRDYDKYRTFLDGNIGELSTGLDNSYHIVVTSNTDESAVLDGFSIVNGNADDQESIRNSAGGGLYNESGSPIIRNSTFKDNNAVYGAGVYNKSASPDIYSSTFTGNTAERGAGIYNDQSSVTLASSSLGWNTGRGAGIFNINSSLDATDTLFEANYGGGIEYQFSSSTLTRCTLIGNSSGFGAGINSFTSSSLVLIDCDFNTNTAVGGAAVYIQFSSSLSMTNCTFTANVADTGGALVIADSSATLRYCTFTGNSATGFGAGGGAVLITDSSPSLIDCTFTGNSASFWGGAIRVSGGTPIIRNCTFSNNSGQWGGAITNVAASPWIINSTFSANTATQRGGAISNDQSSGPVLRNCVFTRNSVRNEQVNDSYGGAIFNRNSSPTLINCTLVDNKSSYLGDSIASESASSPRVVNSIIWNTIPSTTQLHSRQGGSFNVTFSDVQGGHSGKGNINLDPLFVGTPSPGPDEQWGTGDDDDGNLHLRLDSPGIDAGSNAAVPADLATDLDGNPRIADVFGVHDPGPIVDIGAYELTPVPLNVSGTDGDDHFYLRLSTDPPLLDIWNSSPPAGDPRWSLDPRTLSTLTFTGAGEDTLFLELGGATLCNPILFESHSLTLDAPFGSSAHLSDITIAHKLRLAPARKLTLIVRKLNLLPDSRLDIADNAVIVQDGDYWQLFNWLKSARAGSPRWTGPGIGTSAANADQGLAIQQIGRDVKIKFTWNGDLNLDGRVNADDYFFIDQGFLQKPTPPTYHDGDFNFDGRIDADDYFLIDQAFLNQTPSLSSPKPALFTTLRRSPSSLFSRKRLSHRAHRVHRA